MADQSVSRVLARLSEREIVEGPFSPEEYALLVHWRRTNFRPSTPAEDAQFEMLTIRYHTQLARDENEAWHEAGHAVVGHVLGCPAVFIHRQSDGTPRTLHEGISSTAPRTRIEADFLAQDRNWALIQVAGYLAERRATGHDDAGEASEFVIRAEHFLGYESAQQRAYLERIEPEASTILDTNWDAVERVAALLREKMQRRGDEVLAAITAS
jgi:hypothetical protein